MNWTITGAVSGFLAVVLGAIAAHGLHKMLDPHALDLFRLGTQYQMYHALALLTVGLWASKGGATVWPLHFAGWCFLGGTALFSGSLYALALTDERILGAITPFGGLMFLAGWGGVAFSAWGNPK